MKLKIKPLYLLIFLINIFIVFYYQVSIYRAFFNSDAAVTNILAQEILKSGSYYPSSWWYVNGDIWTLFKHTLAIPLHLLGFASYDVHTIVVLGFFTFSLFITFMYLKKISTDNNGIVVAFIGISTLYSPMYAREVFGESAYIWYYSAIIFYLYFFYIITQEEEKREKVWVAALFVVLITIGLVSENPSRFAIYFIASLFVPLFLFYGYINIKYKKIAIYFGVGVFLGLAYRYAILSQILMQTGVQDDVFLIPLDELPTHIWRSLIGVINLYGGDWGEETIFASFGSATYMLKLLLFPIAFFAPLYYAIKKRESLNPFEIYTISVGYIAFLIIFGIYSITSLHLDGLYAAKENIRYIIPFVLLISLVNGIVWRFFSKRVKFLLLFCILLSYLSMPNTLQVEAASKIIKQRESVIETLMQNGVTKGYAPYWHSHVFTVLSNNKVEIRPLEDENKRVGGMWLTSTTWYDKTYTDKESFILLPKEKIAAFEEASKENNLSEPTNTIELEGYKIYIFDQNPIVSNTK